MTRRNDTPHGHDGRTAIVLNPTHAALSLPGQPRSVAHRRTAADLQVFRAIDATLDLSRGDGGILETVSALDAQSRTVYLEQLASLLSQGVVGTEVVEVNGELRERFLTTRLGDERLRRARNVPSAAPRHLDVRA